jgi:hypothetical protein
MVKLRIQWNTVHTTTVYTTTRMVRHFSSGPAKTLSFPYILPHFNTVYVLRSTLVKKHDFLNFSTELAINQSTKETLNQEHRCFWSDMVKISVP